MDRKNIIGMTFFFAKLFCCLFQLFLVLSPEDEVHHAYKNLASCRQLTSWSCRLRNFKFLLWVKQLDTIKYVRFKYFTEFYLALVFWTNCMHSQNDYFVLFPKILNLLPFVIIFNDTWLFLNFAFNYKTLIMAVTVSGICRTEFHVLVGNECQGLHQCPRSFWNYGIQTLWESWTVSVIWVNAQRSR